MQPPRKNFWLLIPALAVLVLAFMVIIVWWSRKNQIAKTPTQVSIIEQLQNIGKSEVVEGIELVSKIPSYNLRAGKDVNLTAWLGELGFYNQPLILAGNGPEPVQVKKLIIEITTEPQNSYQWSYVDSSDPNEYVTSSSITKVGDETFNIKLHLSKKYILDRESKSEQLSWRATTVLMEIVKGVIAYTQSQGEQSPDRAELSEEINNYLLTVSEKNSIEAYPLVVERRLF